MHMKILIKPSTSNTHNTRLLKYRLPIPIVFGVPLNKKILFILKMKKIPIFEIIFFIFYLFTSLFTFSKQKPVLYCRAGSLYTDI